ncbi:PepSY domain-containing protein [Pararhodobacter sp.]|uniref:PepSY domain-containing protein n=1 Tax=Pararhodobacter sp. TaxID=2127056 RepID=UPI002B0031F4|nr:PepSY domain-containing protein [Pararhodobacter sp.]
MNRILILVAASVFSSAVLAGPSCDVPKEKWMKEADFKAKVEAEGYKIKTFKVTKDNCYEIYGVDKDGKKVEIYFNPETGAELERKS